METSTPHPFQIQWKCASYRYSPHPSQQQNCTFFSIQSTPIWTPYTHQSPIQQNQALLPGTPPTLLRQTNYFHRIPLFQSVTKHTQIRVNSHETECTHSKQGNPTKGRLNNPPLHESSKPFPTIIIIPTPSSPHRQKQRHTTAVIDHPRTSIRIHTPSTVYHLESENRGPLSEDWQCIWSRV